MADPTLGTTAGGLDVFRTQGVDENDRESATTPKATPAYERETTITSNDEDDVITFWTMQRRFISRMRKHPAFRETGSGFYGASEWVVFEVPAKEWNPATGGKRKRDITPEQRAAAADRMRALAKKRKEQ